MFVCRRRTFHIVSLGQGSTITGIQHVSRSGYASTGATSSSDTRFSITSATAKAVDEPLGAWPQRAQLSGYRHDGFWIPMDTFKDKQLLEDMHARGVARGRSGSQSTRGAGTAAGDGF